MSCKLSDCIICELPMQPDNIEHYDDGDDITYLCYQCLKCNYFTSFGPVDVFNCNDHSRAKITWQLLVANLTVTWSNYNKVIRIRSNDSLLYSENSGPFTKEWVDTVYSKYAKLTAFI